MTTRTNDGAAQRQMSWMGEKEKHSDPRRPQGCLFSPRGNLLNASQEARTTSDHDEGPINVAHKPSKSPLPSSSFGSSISHSTVSASAVSAMDKVNRNTCLPTRLRRLLVTVTEWEKIPILSFPSFSLVSFPLMCGIRRGRPRARDRCRCSSNGTAVVRARVRKLQMLENPLPKLPKPINFADSAK